MIHEEMNTGQGQDVKGRNDRLSTDSAVTPGRNSIINNMPDSANS